MTDETPDSWDPATGVGTTATMVAAGRAIATSAGLVIDDPLAAPLVRAVGLDFFTRMLDGGLEPVGLGGFTPERVRQLVSGIALRTKFFDDVLLAAGEAGIRQVVILASGLDTRAYRLAWPAGTTVFEIDHPGVIDFKTTAVQGLGTQPSARHRPVGIDLRDDWPTALQQAGWSADEPTAWCAEGLLIYLPPSVQDQLFDTVTALSARASMIGTDFAPGVVDLDTERVAAASAAMSDQGLNMDMRSLIHGGPRSSPMDYLGRQGWAVSETPIAKLFSDNGFSREQDNLDPLGDIVYVRATLP